MTGGRVLRREPYIDGDTFMVTYGDGVADVDLNRLARFHQPHGRWPRSPPSSRRRGSACSSSTRHACAASPKSPSVEGWISAGFFVFNRRVFDISTATPASSNASRWSGLAPEGQLMAYRHEGFFFAMDTYREYQQLNRVWDSGNAPWKIW